MIAATPLRIDDRKSFQKLKTMLHRRLVQAIDLSDGARLDEAEVRDQVRALATHLCSARAVGLPTDMRDRMADELMDEIYGLGPLEALMNDPEVSDILVTGPDSVSIERGGVLEETDVRFADETHLLHWIRRLAARAGRKIDALSPMVDARLPDGSRLSAVIAPMALCGPTLSIRRLKPNVLQLDDLVAAGTLAPEMADFLAAAVRGRLNILVSGGAGAGKTTLLNNLARYVPRTERMITVEHTGELQLGRSDVVSLELRAPNAEGESRISPRDLMRRVLRMRPDRILLGEARGGEIAEMLQAMNTGCEGSMTSVHASDAPEALARIELMAATSDIETSAETLRPYIAAAIQIVIHVARLSSGERRILRIAEVCGSDDDGYRIEDIFLYRAAGTDSHGRGLGSFYATGYEPSWLPRLSSCGVALPEDLFLPHELGLAEEAAWPATSDRLSPRENCNFI